MAIKEERDRILKMIEEGKITAEEGVKLLEALEGSDKAQLKEVPLFHRKGNGGRVIRLIVTDVSSGKVRVNMSLPFGVVDFLSGLIPEKEKRKMEEKGIVLESLIESIRAGETGKVLEVDDEEEGKKVEIIVE